MIEKTQENTTFVIKEKSKPNSFEFGKANNRFKIYFDTQVDLEIQLKSYINLGLVEEDALIKFREGIKDGISRS